MASTETDFLADILAFHLEAGVDVALGEAPVDRFAESTTELQARNSVRAASAPVPMPMVSQAPAAVTTARPLTPGRTASSLQSPSASPQAVSRQAPPPPEQAALDAREAAQSAADLDALRLLLERFDGCPLKATATRLVFEDGNRSARVMFVGEAPGREEDIEGKPFVGRSGKLLDRMMAAISLDRDSAYIANVVPWRPPGNRTPTPQETSICLPFIRRQIELANPDVLVCLGGPSTQTLLGITDGITKARGRWGSYDTGTRSIRAIATFHPAYLLRTPLGKRMAWRDFLAISKALAAPA